MDRLDRELGYGVFWPEATADYHEQMYQGTGHGFVDMVMDAHLNYVAQLDEFSNILITVDGDTARARRTATSRCAVSTKAGTPIDSRNLGRYVDRWEKRSGEWRIIDRAVSARLLDAERSIPRRLHDNRTTRPMKISSYFPSLANVADPPGA